MPFDPSSLNLLKPAARYPADPRAVFILAISVFGGLIALTLSSGPGTLNHLMPTWAVYIWGALLTSGSLVTLAGMAFQSVNGVIAEQIGSVMVGATTVFYASCAIWIVGAASLQPVLIILAWGLSCFVRWAQLQALLSQSAAEELRSQVTREVRTALEEEGL